MNKSPQIFFNSSLFRSGGTLLQNIIAQNPEFYCTPTSGLIDLLNGVLNSYEDSDKNFSLGRKNYKKATYNFINQGFKGYASSFSSSNYFLDKNISWNFYYPLLKDIFGEVKMVCFVRDLRSVFSSIEKNFRQNPSFIIKDLPIQNTKNRLIHFLKNHSLSRDIYHIEQRITEKNFNDILFIKFEDFCLNPQFFISKIYSFLNIPDYTHNLNYIPQLVNENDEIHYPIGTHNIKNTIQLPKKDYEEVLGKDLCNWIYKEYEWYFQIFNYQK
jgi:sulfotransferase